MGGQGDQGEQSVLVRAYVVGDEDYRLPEDESEHQNIPAITRVVTWHHMTDKGQDCDNSVQGLPAPVSYCLSKVPVRQQSTQMDKAELPSCPADSEQDLVAKRTAFEEPNLASDAKRIKSSHDGLTGPATTRRVPFPEKVC